MARRKKEIVIAKDFGEITVPTSWDEINLETFIKFMQLSDDNEGKEPNIVDIMAILTGRDKKFIYSLPNDFAETIMAHLLFLNQPLSDEPKSEVEINGEVYKINYMEKLKFGEYTDANSVIQGDPYNYAGLLAILCRKDKEIYDDDFIADKLDKRIEMWNAQPITKVYPLVCFFLTLYTISEGHLKDYMTEGEQIINQSLTDIEDFLNSGEVKKFSMTYVKARWKLHKLRKCMSRLS